MRRYVDVVDKFLFNSRKSKYVLEKNRVILINERLIVRNSKTGAMTNLSSPPLVY